jgi:DNA-binding NarL/FixJ family response regulator
MCPYCFHKCTKLRKQVLIIDDDPITLSSIRSIVTNYINRKGLNFEILEGTDGSDLIKHVKEDKENRIKLILTDENMSNIEGSEAILAIKDLKESNDIKVVSITSMDDLASIERIINCGADEVYTKPVNKYMLESVLKFYLG